MFKLDLVYNVGNKLKKAKKNSRRGRTQPTITFNEKRYYKTL